MADENGQNTEPQQNSTPPAEPDPYEGLSAEERAAAQEVDAKLKSFDAKSRVALWQLAVEGNKAVQSRAKPPEKPAAKVEEEEEDPTAKRLRELEQRLAEREKREQEREELEANERRTREFNGKLDREIAAKCADLDEDEREAVAEAAMTMHFVKTKPDGSRYTLSEAVAKAAERQRAINKKKAKALVEGKLAARDAAGEGSGGTARGGSNSSPNKGEFNKDDFWSGKLARTFGDFVKDRK